MLSQSSQIGASTGTELHNNNNKINNNKNTTKIYQEGVYNKSGIWNKTLTHKIKIK